MNEQKYNERYRKVDLILKQNEDFYIAYKNDCVVNRFIKAYLHGDELDIVDVLVSLSAAQSKINKDLRDTLVKNMCFEPISMIIKNPTEQIN